MISPGTPTSIIVGLVFFGALIVLGYVLLDETVGLFAELDQPLAAALLVALAGAVLIGTGVRRAGYAAGVRRLRLQRKAAAYERALHVVTCAALPGAECEIATVAAELRAAGRRIALWGNVAVLKEFAMLHRLGPHLDAADPAVRTTIEALLREMRRDLDQGTIGLKTNDLIEVMLGDGSAGSP